MGNNTPNRSAEQFPFVPALILLVVFGFALALFLAGQPRIAPQVRPTVTIRPSATPITPTAVAAVPSEVPAQNVSAGTYARENVRAGENVILATCSACHGMNARGIQGLGKNLLDSEFIDSLTDDELVAFIRVGREASDPLNTTGVPMPASGGNPGLTDQNLYDVVAYLRVNADHPERIGSGGGAVGGSDAPAATPTLAGTPTPTTPFVLPINRIGGATATPTEAFVLPINRIGGGSEATPEVTPGQ
ncbi:MAG: cytochrome c [Anaerolineae bacterium]|nr:cytochrome c [Anaerolineae bacterium]